MKMKGLELPKKGGCYSPILRKITAQVVSKTRPAFVPPTQVTLEDWWLSRPVDGEGIAVSGRPLEIRKCDDARTIFNSASPKKRYALREFNSTKVVKRNGATMLETFDGIIVFLCGFINKSRTQQNGFTSEVCRDFIHGFPLNWDNYTAQSADEELKCEESFIENFSPEDLDSFNGAHLHDMVLSLTDTGRERFIERINNISTVNPQAVQEFDVQPSTASPSTPVHILGLPDDNIVAKASTKRRRNTLVDVSLTQVPKRHYRRNQNRP